MDDDSIRATAARMALVTDPEIQGCDLRVLETIKVYIGWDNLVRLKQFEICELTGMSAPSVSRAFKKLTEKGVLIRGRRRGHSYDYRLNSLYL